MWDLKYKPTELTETNKIQKWCALKTRDASGAHESEERILDSWGKESYIKEDYKVPGKMYARD